MSEEGCIEFEYGDIQPEVETFTVRFYASKDATEIISEETVPSGETVTGVPVLDENFTGWYDRETSKRWDPTTPVTKDLSLYARYRVQGETAEPEESGRDSGLHVVTFLEEEHIYMVKGQSYAFEAKDSDNKQEQNAGAVAETTEKKAKKKKIGP